MKTSLCTLAAAAAILSVMSLPHDASAADDKEKCAGVVKAGKNDCKAGSHSCAGHAKADAAADEWVYVPKGLCERLAGGKVVEGEKH